MKSLALLSAVAAVNKLNGHHAKDDPLKISLFRCTHQELKQRRRRFIEFMCNNAECYLPGIRKWLHQR